jgi:hypothetical protein
MEVLHVRLSPQVTKAATVFVAAGFSLRQLF